jgi:DNA repair protein RadA/Sms
MVEEVKTDYEQIKDKGALYRREPEILSEIKITEDERIKTHIFELDRILGGGIVTGSVVLVGGEPGIGKSTLLLQVSRNLARQNNMILYISGEESVKQTKLWPNRLNCDSQNLYLVNETNLDLIIEYIKKLSPKVVIVDSIQVLYKSVLSSIPGSITQVRECAGELTLLAKGSGVSIFLVGHITKEGSIAGPKVLEHIVDCVLYFEGERHTSFRLLRAVKNRFGPTNEVGVFQMTQEGLMEVANPSELFLSQRPQDSRGSIVTAAMEGSRPILVEVQALVTATSFGMPRRWSQGVDYNRTLLLIAVLEKRLGLGLKMQDVYVNVAGGVRVGEPAIDLAIASAIASSFRERYIQKDTVTLGEVGLGGEVRAVSQLKLRIEEAHRLGFKRCILPKSGLSRLRISKDKIELVAVNTVKEALEAALIK